MQINLNVKFMAKPQLVLIDAAPYSRRMTHSTYNTVPKLCRHFVSTHEYKHTHTLSRTRDLTIDIRIHSINNYLKCIGGFVVTQYLTHHCSCPK